MKATHKVAALVATLITYGSLAGGANGAVNVLVTRQPDGTGSRISLSGTLNPTDFGFSFTQNLASTVSTAQHRFTAEGFVLPNAQVALAGVQSYDSSRSRISAHYDNDGELSLQGWNFETLSRIDLLGTYVSGNFGIQFNVTRQLGTLPDFGDITILSRDGSVINTSSPQELATDHMPTDGWNLDLVIDVDDDVSAFTDFVVDNDNNTANGNFFEVTVDATAVPEPSFTLLLGFGALGMVARRKRTI